MVGFLHNNGIGAKEARRAWTLVFCTMLSEEQIGADLAQFRYLEVVDAHLLGLPRGLPFPTPKE